MKSGLACGSFLCIIRQYLVVFGGGDGGYLNLVLAPAPASGLISQRSGHHYEVGLGLGIVFMYNMSIFGAFWGFGMVATLSWVLALAPASGLIRQRSGHHYEVRLGLGIIFMCNMSIFGGFWGWGWWLP